MERIDATAYLAANGYVDELKSELGEAAAVHGRLVVAPGPPRPAAWAENVWLDPVRLSFISIAEGAARLRAIQRNWALYAHRLHRRAALIEERLPHLSAKPLHFPAPAPTAPLGSWTLLDRNTILASARCSSPFCNGAVAFVEDKAGPPNRAYLKLWEVLTLIGRRPGPGEVCLDLGASPGGWTWALAKLGARVLSVDKAPLATVVAALPGVEFRRESAFSLDPTAVGPVDWLFCDVVCYPDRLLRLVRTWLESGLVRRFVCTVKFQGPTDFVAQQAFAGLAGGVLVHLHHNKHELTWMKLQEYEYQAGSLPIFPLLGSAGVVKDKEKPVTI
jgi:23S rRNA (cytidine2498-2'-O)-methyltransferase